MGLDRYVSTTSSSLEGTTSSYQDLDPVEDLTDLSAEDVCRYAYQAKQGAKGKLTVCCGR